MLKKIKEEIIYRYFKIRTSIVSWSISVMREHIQYKILLFAYLSGYKAAQIADIVYNSTDGHKSNTNKIQRFLNLYPSLDMNERCRETKVLKNCLMFKAKLRLALLLTRNINLEFDPLDGI